ncbi:transmembrane protein 154 [Sceloporus undulatus]|uniref:transmembrane protein 154 n=1 Tax=Sceloporus undulatus TaxID=8520 RepID=UPI001C4C52E5|nr:transmembrane protein 154 [Sceloporus undulatus]
MKKYKFVLSLFLLLSERPLCYGSADAVEGEEASGDNPTLSTITVIADTTTSAVFLTSDQDLHAATMLTETENSEMGSTSTTQITDLEPESLHPAVIFGVPAALLLVLLILLVIFIVRRHKQKQLKQDELGSENCKSPIFEEDTPSVMEIEMEELDKWMNSLKRNAESEYLPPVKEEKDCNANPSDCES